MSSINTISYSYVLHGHTTHENAVAKTITPEQQLRRSVMSCMLWEATFYEDGKCIADRIAETVDKLDFDSIASIAIEAREKMKLRHVPLLLVVLLAKRKAGRKMGDLIERVIQRPDELSEILAIYWKNGRKPISSQIKIGLARAFRKFNEYQLAKYNRDTKVKLKDVLFLSHAKPKDDAQAEIWKKLADGSLATPDTWEVALSSGADKCETFERLIKEKKLGGLAFLRNLRNMLDSGVDQELITSYFSTVNFGRVLPFRFISAARHAPKMESAIEEAMLRCLEGAPKLSGKTAIVIDNSGSMYGTKVSSRSDIDRSDAACALAILLREMCENPLIISFSDQASIVPSRRGFALADAIKFGSVGGTDIYNALNLAEKEGYDRIIVLTDEQSSTQITNPKGKGYFINVATYENGIGYGEWLHIDGWSEAIVDYIIEYEKDNAG